MELWAAAAICPAVAVLGAAVAAPFFTYRDPKRRADVQQDLFVHRGWYVAGAITWALSGAFGFALGVSTLRGSEEAALLISGWVLLIGSLTPISPIAWWVYLARTGRAARRSAQQQE